MTGQIVYVTGCERGLFVSTCILLESFRRHDPACRLYVCDFGLADAQREFFNGLGVLLERPANLELGHHPFYYKASLGLYSREMDFGTLVWLDADTLVTGPLTTAVQGINESLPTSRPAIAIAKNRAVPTVGELYARFEVEPFRQLLQADSIPETVPYYNSGFFVIRGKTVLEKWRELSFEVEVHSVFEQNMLNYLIHRGDLAVQELSNRQFNVHDVDLPELTQAEADGTVLFTLGDCAAILLHMTSSVQGILAKNVFVVSARGESWKITCRWCMNAPVFRYQRRLVESFFDKHVQQLKDLGLLDVEDL